MSFLSTVWKKTRRVATGIFSSAWEKARAIAGGLTGVAFTASSVFDLEKVFLRIKGTGLIFPILTLVISGMAYVKEAIQEESHDGIKALQKNKLFNFLRDQLQADTKQVSLPGSNSTTSASLINILKKKISGQTRTDLDSAIESLLNPPNIETDDSANATLTKNQENALLLALSGLYDESHSGWQKYSHATLLAAFSLVSGFSEGLQLSVFENINTCLFDFTNLIAFQSLLPAALTAIGLYHAIRSFRGVKASYEQPSLPELEGFLTQLVYNMNEPTTETTPLLTR